MLRSMRILLLSSLVLTPVPFAAMAQTSTTPAEADKAAADVKARAEADARAKADAEAKAKALAAAIAACDRGASAPLDREAKAAPVQFAELMPDDFDMTKLETLLSQCQQAWAGAPKDKRLQLQWLRVMVAIGKPGQEWLLVPQLKMLADEGSAEARYLMFKMYWRHHGQDDEASFPIRRDQALGYLRAAADQGHITALLDLMVQYRTGPLVRTDVKEAVKIARRIESAPPQGSAESRLETEIRTYIPMTAATMTLEEDGFPEPEQRIAVGIVAKDSEAGTNDHYSALTYIKALRLGRGIAADPVKARALLEARVAKKNDAAPMLADMLARGEGGPADPKRALAMLRADNMRHVTGAGHVLAGLLLDGKVVGRQPQEAIRVLANAWNLEDQLLLAGLLVDYQPRLENPKRLIDDLTDAAAVDEPGAAIALARLKLSDNSQFTDVEGARTLLRPLMDAGDRQALWLYAGSQYTNLTSSSSQPYRRDGGLSDEDLKRVIAEGIEKKEAEAYLLRARLTRKGVVYPQDDEAATNLLISAANLGSVEGMVLLGNAYDDGLGTPKNPKERLHAWREAAKRGSLAAKQNLGNAFIFDSFNRLMKLDEGVTGPLVLYINSVDRTNAAQSIDDTFASARLGSMFSFGSRAMEAGAPAVADAVMDAFREAPAGLDERTLVMLGKAMPDEIRAAIEKKLKSEGFYSGQPNGYFGPDARSALAAWVEAKGPIVQAAVPVIPEDESKPKAGALVADEIVARVRDRAFKDGMSAKSDRQKLEAISALNVLAQYGDMAPRWALVRNYHQARVVRKVVSPAEITRYALDVMVSKPQGVEKAEFEFIFDITQIAQDRKIKLFGSAVLAAIRDDVRLQDPLTLGGIMQQFIFAPAACDAVLATAKKARIKELGQDGCDNTTMTALIAFAKESGPAGVDAEARKAAAVEIKAMDVEAQK